MRLGEWRVSQGWTQRQLADALGCNQASVSFLERRAGENSGQIPKRDLMLAIFRVTQGAVTPNDFYDLPSIDQLSLPICVDDPPLLACMVDSASDGAASADAAVDNQDRSSCCETAD